MKIGDKVLISPDLTKLPDWTHGTVIEVENNPFVGVVISAETEDRNVFFGYQGLFKLQNEERCTH
ncbi:transcriptional regulator [Hoylesella marshii]|uniref:transcriptional regulator n=1 Tax=Hoylesella marshii TaxID=189722 RepID=UPI0028D061DC|nr:transcriptional regulator [Hoylesella marshii]